jgi:hypothetical protein
MLGWWIGFAKVVLFACGSAGYLGDGPASQLAWVYLGLALLAAASALALAPRLELVRPARALAAMLAGTAALAVLCAAAQALGLPGAPLGLLILAHLYNIAAEIAFWLVAAAWLPPPELRRATVWICLATAMGGFFGGLAIEALLALGNPAALAIGIVASCLGAAGWLKAGPGSVVSSGPADMPPPEESDPPAPATWRLVLGHSLGLPLGAAAFLLALVWSLTEFLCLAAYQELYGQQPLGRVLALVFAFLQLVEFACILLLAGPATRWVPPAWRSALFPAGALLTLQLVEPGSPVLWAVLLAHAYTEAASNALFDPVHASNFAAVPARFQPRLRIFADGICYPAGMATGGFVLLFAQSGGDPPHLILLIATVAALLFVGVGLFTGAMVVPSLLSGLGLTAEVGAAPSATDLRRARHALEPWARRSALRNRLLALPSDRPGRTRRDRVERADRRALRAVFAAARRCDPGGPAVRLEVLLDSRSAETRALVVETLLSLPLRRLFRPFLACLRRRYHPG